jgi:hypothetical protein
LARDRAARPASCRELAESFAESARKAGFRGNTEVERFLAETCQDTFDELEHMLSDPTDAHEAPGPPSAPTRRDPAAPSERTAPELAVSTSLRAPGGRRSAALWAGGALLAVATAGAIALTRGEQRAAAPEPPPPTVAPAAQSPAPATSGEPPTSPPPIASASAAPSSAPSALPAVPAKRGKSPLMGNPY